MIKIVEILLIEDNQGDVRLCQEALKEAKIVNNLNIANDGEEAINRLFQKEPYENSVTPDLIILDLNIPKIDGREVLRLIKEDEKLKTIPVVILTSSKAEEDIVKSYQLHANSYITKPLDFEQFITIVKKINEFWLSIVKLPNRD